MTSYETNPKWLYKPIEVDNLKEIQKEIIPIIYKKIPNFNRSLPQFKIIMRDEIEPFAPLYTEFIKKFGMIERWELCVLVTTNLNIDFNIHVDNSDWKTSCYGLNIPIINCDNSYTVWYDTELEDTIYDDDDIRNTARIQKPKTDAIEIERLDASQPAWVNTSIPHRPVSTHTRPRAILSARFNPELHDLLYL